MHTYIYITSHTHTHTYTHTPTHTHTHTHTHTNAELSTRLSLVTDPRTNIKHLQLKLATKKERNIKFIQKKNHKITAIRYAIQLDFKTNVKAQTPINYSLVILLNSDSEQMENQ
jgi:hypothetical protein